MDAQASELHAGHRRRLQQRQMGQGVRARSRRGRRFGLGRKRDKRDVRPNQDLEVRLRRPTQGVLRQARRHHQRLRRVRQHAANVVGA